MSISILFRRLLSSVAFGTLIATGVFVISRCSPSNVCANIDPVTLAFTEESIPDAALELLLTAA
ncbi:MAG: hypothetical protein KDK34_16055, partial [Leptospiraceae bacterium]|nr:hypothetical protein [Leptospiraceae bacterium]